MLPGVVVLRQGAVWRQLTIVPEARLQSVAVSEGPVFRALNLATVRVHTVAGPISPALSAVDRAQALVFFREVADAAISSSSADTSHRWRSGEVTP